MLCLAFYVNVTDKMYPFCFCKNILSLEAKGESDHSLDPELTASSLYFTQSFVAHCRSCSRSEGNAIHLGQGATSQGVRYGNPLQSTEQQTEKYAGKSEQWMEEILCFLVHTPLEL